MVSTYSTETTLTKHDMSIKCVMCIHLIEPRQSEHHLENLDYFFERLRIFVFQVASTSGGLQRDTSIEVEDEFHRAPESSSTELQRESPTEPRTQERTPEEGTLPRVEETPWTREDANGVQKVEDGVDGRVGVDPESENGVYPAMDSVEGREKGYPGMESVEERENREAMEAWEAQRGIEGAGFR